MTAPRKGGAAAPMRQRPAAAASRAAAAKAPKRVRAARPMGEDSPDSVRQQLIRAAIPLFARHGYEAVSTAQIARAANVTQPTVHYHFQSKDRIWREAIDTLMRDLGRAFPNRREELKDVEPVARLKVMTRRFVLMSARDPTLGRIVMHEGLARSERLNWLVKRYVGRGFRNFDDAIREGVEAGRVKPLPAYSLSHTIMSASSFTFCLAALVQQVHHTDITRKERIREMADAIVEILFHGLVSPSALTADR